MFTTIINGLISGITKVLPSWASQRLTEKSTSSGLTMLIIGIGLYTSGKFESEYNVIPYVLILIGAVAVLIKSSKWGNKNDNTEQK